MEPRQIYFIVDDFWGCAWYRCHTPGVELKRRGHEVLLDAAITPDLVQKSDVIVFQRQWRVEARQAMRYAKSLGKKVVYELDDDLWNLDPTNPAFEAWNNPFVIGGAEELLRNADLVTTTTPALAAQLRRFNKEVRVLPNMLPSDYWRLERERPKDYDRVALGWAGSSNRWKDLSIVRDVIPQLLDRYPNVDLHIATGDDRNMIFGEHPRIHRIAGVTIEEYPKSLLPFDIGIAPVVDSRFNQSKSDLKFIEYGILGIPTVASNVESYTHSVVNGENGFLAKNDKQWLKYLTRLIEQPEVRAEIGANAKAYAESRIIERNVQLWEDAYGLDRLEAAG